MITKPINDIYNALCLIRNEGTCYGEAKGITILPRQRIVDDDHLRELEYYIKGVRDTICKDGVEE